MTTAGAALAETAAEKRARLARLLADAGARPAPPTVLAAFERWVRETPDAPAVAAGDRTATYAELDAEATKIAAGLRPIGAGARVGVALRRGVTLVAALFGVLKAGGTWCALDEDDPPARIERLRRGLNVVIAQDGTTRVLSHAPVPRGVEPPLSLVMPDEEIVAVPGRAVAERLAWLGKSCPLGAADTALFACSLHDISFVTTLLWPLASGAKVVISAAAEAEPVAQAALVRSAAATLAVVSPAALAHLRDLPPCRLFLDRDPEPAELADFGSPSSLVTLWHYPEAGGPIVLQPAEGAPMVGADLRILDGYGQPAPVGAVGDLSCRPFEGAPLMAMGERVRRRADGRFEARPAAARTGRRGGIRFSLPPMERLLGQAPGAQRVHAMARHDEAGADRLVAYVVPLGDPMPEAWRDYADHHLPRWQRPDAWVPVSTLPLAASGVVDDKALAALPVIDDEIARHWTMALARNPGVGEAAALARPREPKPAIPVVVPISRPIGPAARTSKSRSASSSTPALVDGGPLLIAEDAPKTLTEALQRTADRYPDREIVFHTRSGTATRLCYAELRREALRIAGGLAATGLKPGDPVILQIPSLRQHSPAFWGCVLAGLRPVTIAVSPVFTERTALVAKLLNTWDLLGRPPIVAPAELGSSLKTLDRFVATPLTLIDPDRLAVHALLETVHAAAPTDVLFLQLSSGSTGIPKCIPITHRGVVAHIAASVRAIGYDADDVALNWLPMDHVVPMLTWHLRDTYLGVRQIQVETACVLADPLVWLDLIAEHRVTRSWSPNFGFKLVSGALRKAPDRSWDLGSLKSLMNAGEQVTVPVCAEFLDLVSRFGVAPDVMQPAFGMAEACTCMTYETGFHPAASTFWVDKATLADSLVACDPDEAGAVSFVRLGPPVAGVAIRIADAEGVTLPEGEIGRLEIKGDVVTPGYLHNAEANAQAFVGDGWFNSGDLGFILDGRLALTGREKELIVVNGANFYCYEIEDIVNAVDGVQPTFAAACGVPDPATGSEALAVFFVPQSGTDAGLVAAAICGAVALRIGLSPAHVVALPEHDFPKTTSGKIQRMALRQRLIGDLDAGARHRTLPAWFHQEVWLSRRLEAPRIAPCGVLLFGGADEVTAAIGRPLSAAGLSLIEVVGGNAFARLGPGRFALDLNAASHHAALFDALAADKIDVEMVVDLRPLGEGLHTAESPCGSSLRPDAEKVAQRTSRSTHGPASFDTPPRAAARDEGGLSFQTTSERANRLCAATLVLLQALARQSRPLTYVLMTRHGLPTGGVTDQVQAGLRGLLRSAAEERFDLVCRQIDVDDVDLTDCADRIADAILRPDGEAEVALRGRDCLVPRLQRIDPADAASGTPVRLRWGGRYLVTGGLGAIGRALVRHLVATCGAKILVVGRGDAADRVAECEELARLSSHSLYRAADATDAEALEAAMRQAEIQFGGPIEGVFHLAGVSASAELAEETAAGLMTAFRPKIVGAEALLAVMDRRPGGFVVLWSSVNALFGASGAAAYAMANAALAGVRSRGATTTLNLLWSRWQNLGMSAELGSGVFAEARGFSALPLDDALTSLDAALAMGLPNLSIGLDDTKPFVQARLAAPGESLVELAGFVVPRAAQRMTALGGSITDRFGVEIRPVVHVLERMPRTADGDLDRHALLGATGTGGTTGGHVEDQLSAIWREVLNRARLQPGDNFFAVGGHSLAAARLVYRLRETFGIELPLRVLFETPTLAGMARWIEAQAPREDLRHVPDCLVALQPEGTRPPLFCVHPAGGSPLCYVFLSDHLGREQPFYGFQAPGLFGEREPIETVEALAETYVAAMRAQQPAGPYRIGAWSSGGPVAFEMARQLEAAGSKVALLALFDCAVMEADNLLRSTDRWRHAKALWRLLGFAAQVRFPRRYGDLVALGQLVGIALPAHFRQLRIDRAFWRGLGRSVRLFNLNTTMGYRYRPGRIASPALLFRAGSRLGAEDPLERELRCHADDVRRIDLDANHMSMMLDADGARMLAGRLAKALAEAEPESR